MKNKDIFYIYGVDDSVRGGHWHHKTIQAAICISGSCVIYDHDGQHEEEFVLDKPSKSKDTILIVLASVYFSDEDYYANPIND